MPRVSSKNQVTLPVEAMRAAGLRSGDEVTVRPIGNGEVVVATRGSRISRHAGIGCRIGMSRGAGQCDVCQEYCRSQQ